MATNEVEGFGRKEKVFLDDSGAIRQQSNNQAHHVQISMASMPNSRS